MAGEEEEEQQAGPVWLYLCPVLSLHSCPPQKSRGIFFFFQTSEMLRPFTSQNALLDQQGN
jgi:hypothetical protein